jgi:hypothetical protein
MGTPAGANARFDKDEEAILRILGEDPSAFPSAARLAEAIKQGETRTRYYIDRLKMARVVGDRLYANGRAAEYYLRDRGRAYLVENGLI